MFFPFFGFPALKSFDLLKEIKAAQSPDAEQNRCKQREIADSPLKLLTHMAGNSFLSFLSNTRFEMIKVLRMKIKCQSLSISRSVLSHVFMPVGEAALPPLIPFFIAAFGNSREVLSLRS